MVTWRNVINALAGFCSVARQKERRSTALTFSQNKLSATTSRLSFNAIPPCSRSESKVSFKNYSMKTNGQTLLFADLEAPGVPTRQRANLTFKANRSLGRHNWLRLTPAYSRHLVEQLVNSLGSRDRVLDPFCGTGTTALTCAEHGIRADTVDINPFLVWLANAKFAAYTLEELAEAKNFQTRLRLPADKNGFWHPPLADIEKWWTEDELAPLSALYNSIKEADVSEPARNLLFSAFCRVAIETASVSFGHQSMSFKPRNGDNGMVKTCAREQVSGLFRQTARGNS